MTSKVQATKRIFNESPCLHNLRLNCITSKLLVQRTMRTLNKENHHFGHCGSIASGGKALFLAHSHVTLTASSTTVINATTALAVKSLTVLSEQMYREIQSGTRRSSQVCVEMLSDVAMTKDLIDGKMSWRMGWYR